MTAQPIKFTVKVNSYPAARHRSDFNANLKALDGAEGSGYGYNLMSAVGSWFHARYFRLWDVKKEVFERCTVPCVEVTQTGTANVLYFKVSYI